MNDPLAEPSFLDKIGMTLLGSVLGSICAIGASPAESRRDAIVRCGLGICFSFCIVPIAVRGCVKWCGISNPAILDTTLAVGCLIGLGSWWLIHAIVAVVKRRSESSIDAAIDHVIPKDPK